ncbi:fatty acid desaturase [Stieleria varia]|uniref:Fatty acid desaturase n=1 Tax=Stieleria varia TaxID=2528005 RepID=A0A5C6A3H1_9BACT|nr:fatty acid desaturase [Stieleria varia]TWT94452.1 Fatty acid desaturase [Stieleria varia]
MTSSNHSAVPPGGFKLRFHPRIFGSAAPVFPGFEIDISDRVDDADRPDAVWHRDRAKQMIKAHPEIKGLIGNNPYTFIWCILFTGAQIGVAAAAGMVSWWLVPVLAYFIGAWINICLFMLAHECNHNLVFKKTAPNRWLYTLTTMPMFLSGHHTWWVEHHVHHNDLGAKKDFVKRRRSFMLLTRQQVLWKTEGPLYKAFSWLATPLFSPYSLLMLVTQVMRSVLGLIVYVFESLLRGRLRPGTLSLKILADEHLVSGYVRNSMTGWAVIYPLFSLGLTVALFFVGGWKALVFLLLSQLFMTGFLNPVMFGMILSNSHFHGHSRYQPSSSYYGWMNWFTFNFGLHTEHHDISGIPWNRLPKMRQYAPEFYDNIVQTESYARLALQFAFGSRDKGDTDFDNEVYRNAEMFRKMEEEQAAAAAGKTSESDSEKAEPADEIVDDARQFSRP